MSEIGEVLAAIEALSAKGERMALATIVAVRGSTYRRPGARLLVPEEGAPVGNISGGCLEGDVADMARVVMDEGRARLAGWDLTADDDAVWGLGLGCNGAIEVFIEPAEKAAEVAGVLRTALEEERPISVVTVVESSEAGVQAGARLVVKPDGTTDGTLGDARVDAAAVEAAIARLREERSEVRTLIDGVRAFVEVLDPPLRLVVCGAGHDAIPLVRIGVGARLERDRGGRSPRVPHTRTIPRSGRLHRDRGTRRCGEGGTGRRAHVRRRDDAQLPSGQGVRALVARISGRLRRDARARRPDGAAADGTAR